MKAHVIVIVGPTASGKSAFAVQLSQKLSAPILNADSRQVYRELGVAVAKPSAEEQAAAPHHLLDYVSIHDRYSAGQWSKDARALLESLTADSQTSTNTFIVSGGAGLHVKSFVEGIPPMPPVSAEIRAAVELVLAKAGKDALLLELQDKDPEYYQLVDRDNIHRVMRAVSAMRASDRTFTQLRAAPRNPLPYQISWIILDPPREALYQRINERVDTMMQEGLLEQAKALSEFRNLDALQTIGYQEFWPYFDGIYSLAEAVRLVKRNSRHYARRQSTWNRKLTGLRLETPDVNAALKYLKA